MSTPAQPPAAQMGTRPLHIDGQIPASRASQQSDDRSLGDILSDVTEDLSTLLRQELELAKTEMKQEATRAGRGAGMLGAAAIAAHFALAFLSLALVYLLNNWLPQEAAALITAAIWLIAAISLAKIGKKTLAQANPELPQTQRSLKENAQWAKQRKN